MDIRRHEGPGGEQAHAARRGPAAAGRFGRGGLSDVEWLVPAAELRRVTRPELRTTSTLPPCTRRSRRSSWGPRTPGSWSTRGSCATDIHNGNVLRSGRASASVPSPAGGLEAVARSIATNPALPRS
ncbi:hypothetical protein QJS66_01335 [Kocuria rhizophila]|nr:hypothetical protein QJS66_01335 [Kocuria rhizophila]